MMVHAEDTASAAGAVVGPWRSNWPTFHAVSPLHKAPHVQRKGIDDFFFYFVPFFVSQIVHSLFHRRQIIDIDSFSDHCFNRSFKLFGVDFFLLLTSLCHICLCHHCIYNLLCRFVNFSWRFNCNLLLFHVMRVVKFLERVDLVTHPESHIVDAHEAHGCFAILCKFCLEPLGQVARTRHKALQNEHIGHSDVVWNSYADCISLPCCILLQAVVFRHKSEQKLVADVGDKGHC